MLLLCYIISFVSEPSISFTITCVIVTYDVTSHLSPKFKIKKSKNKTKNKIKGKNRKEK